MTQQAERRYLGYFTFLRHTVGIKNLSHTGDNLLAVDGPSCTHLAAKTC